MICIYRLQRKQPEEGIQNDPPGDITLIGFKVLRGRRGPPGMQRHSCLLMCNYDQKGAVSEDPRERGVLRYLRSH